MAHYETPPKRELSSDGRRLVSQVLKSRSIVFSDGDVKTAWNHDGAREPGVQVWTSELFQRLNHGTRRGVSSMCRPF